MPLRFPEAQVQRMLREFGPDTVRNLADEGFDLALDAFEQKAVELAPVDRGDLQKFVSKRRLPRLGGLLRGRLSFTVHYAATVHELPDEARGPRTRAKPGNEFGKAGPRYLLRPLMGAKRWAERAFGLALARTWRKAAR